MLPKYSFAMGQTEAVKKIFELLNSQEGVYNSIRNREADKEKYAIGSDETFAKERDVVLQHNEKVK